MKKRRNFLAVLLGVLLVFTCINIPISAKSFSDVKSSGYALDGINYVSDNGLMSGTTSTTFSPNSTVSRAMLVTVLYRKAGSPSVSGTIPFTDVNTSSYYYKALVWAYKNDIVNGTTSTTFSPNSDVKRQDAVTSLHRFAVKKGKDDGTRGDLTGFSDYSSLSGYARTPMAWAVGMEIMGGTTPTLLSPKSNITRAQFATIITRYGTNAEKIINSTDRLGIENTLNYFSSPYYMNDNHLSKLRAQYLALTPYSEASVNKYLDDVIGNSSYPFGGSCFGVSSVVALDKLGKIAFNENFSNASNMRGIQNIKRQDSESAITYHQFAYDIVKYIERGLADRPTNIVLQLDNCMKAKSFTLLSFYWDEAGEKMGHSVLVNSCTRNGYTYTLKIIDPNSLAVQTGVFNISSRILKIGDYTYPRVTELEVFDDFSIYDPIDIDSTGNSYSAAHSSSRGASDVLKKEKYATLTVDLAGEFTITNDRGEVFSFSEGELSGDMETYDIAMRPNGPDCPVTLTVNVPVSDSFIFEKKTEREIWLSIADDRGYARVSGSKWEKAVLSTTGSIKLEGDELEYGVAYRPIDENGQPLCDLLSLDGTGIGNVAISGEKDTLTVAGSSGEYTLSKINDYGELVETAVKKPVASIETAGVQKPEEIIEETADHPEVS